MSKAKPVELVAGHRTKEEIEIRKENQEKLKSDDSRIEPTQNINVNQLFIFNSIKGEMKESGILSNLDSYLLTQLAIAIDKLTYLDRLAEDKLNIIFNKDFKSSKKLYFDIFTKCCNDLSMSPQSRAKFANINYLANEKQEDPLLKVLKDD